VTLNLEAGTYVLACFIPSPDGVPHLAKGMLMPIQVSPVSRGADGRGTGSAGDDQDG
jgi:hypothetical protein